MGEIDMRKIQAKKGLDIECKGWEQEAVLRMLYNNLDPEVAEHPEELVVYGGIGKAARNWKAFEAIENTLRNLEADETMLVQSGKPGLIMYGQMTAGSWIYIGSQGIVQGTYETFAELANQEYKSDLTGTITLTAGLGGMGGAQPLAVTMNNGVAICVDVDETRVDKRVETKYCDVKSTDLDEALKMAQEAKDKGEALSIGLVGNAVDIHKAILDKGFKIDIITDQTSAHDPLNGYVPQGYSVEEAKKLRQEDPKKYVELSEASMAKHVELMLEFQKYGAVAFDYGNNIRQVA